MSWLRSRVVLAAVALAVLVVVALSATLAPRATIRSMVASRLQAAGVEHRGLETLRVRLLPSRIVAGPVTFGRPGAAPVRVERIEAIVSLGPLLGRRMVVRRLIVVGARAEAAFDPEQGRMTLNGIAFAPLTVASDDEEGRLEGAPGTLGLEIDTLQLRDAAVALRTDGGGPIDIEIDELALRGPLVTTRSTPTELELRATVNGAPLRVRGTLAATEQGRVLEVDSELDDLTPARLARFSGTESDARGAGALALRGNHRVLFVPGGGISGHSEGTVTGRDVELVTSAGVEVAGKTMRLDYAGDYAFPARDRGQLTGRLGIELEDYAFARPQQARVALGAGRAELSDIEWSIDETREVRLALTPSIELDRVRVSGRMRLSVDLAINVLRGIQYLANGFAERTLDTGLAGWAGRHVLLPHADVEIERLRSSGGRFEYDGAEAAVALTVSGVTEASGVTVQSQNQVSTTRALAMEIDRLSARTSDARDAFEFDLLVRAKEHEVTREGGVVNFDAAETKVDEATLTVTRTEVVGDFKAASALTGVRGTRAGRGGEAPGVVSIATASATFEGASKDVSDAAVSWRVAGDVEAREVAMEAGDPTHVRAAIGRAGVVDARIDQSRHLVVDKLTLERSKLEVLRSYLERWLGKETSPGDRRPATAQAPMAEAVDPLPEEPRERVALAQRLLAQAGFEPGAADGISGSHTDSAVRAFQKAAGLRSDGQISTQVLEALRASTQARPRARRPIGFTFALMDAVDGAELHLYDDVEEEGLKIEVDFDALELRNAASAPADARMEVSARARVNQFSSVSLDGWITPLRTPPDLEVRAQVEHLALPPFSPYAATLAGVHVERGELSSRVAGTVQDGQVQAEITIDLDRLEIEPVSETDAARISEAIGVPVETALELLENTEGHIELTIPVSGTLGDPELDVTEARQQGTAGFLASLSPLSWLTKALEGARGPAAEVAPLVFPAGAAEVDAAGRTYLAELVERLAEDKDAVFSLCGRAVAADTEALAAKDVPAQNLAKKAHVLATDRVWATRTHLVDELGVDPSVMKECRSVYQADDTGPPRVEFQP